MDADDPIQPGAGELPPPSRPARVLWPWILAVAFVFLVVLTLGSVYTLGDLISAELETAQSVPMSGDAAVHWLSDGRHLAIQWFDPIDGTPVVDVLDFETEELRSAPGHLFVLAEPGSPVIWLLPMDAVQRDSARTGATAAGLPFPFDSAPEELVAWDLGRDGSTPSESVPARWRTVPGPAGLDAYFEVDPLKGVYPSKLLFNNKQSSGEGHRAQLPEDTVTFNPIGWSPSGDYFALEELWGPDEWLALGEGERDLLVVDADSGEVSDIVTISAAAASSPVWHPDQDMLLWPVFTDDGTSAGVGLSAFRPGQAPAPIEELSTLVPPDEWRDSSLVTLAGSSENSSIWVTGYDPPVIWRLDAAGLEVLGTLPQPSASVSWSESGGIAAIETDRDSATGQERTVVAVYDVGGGGRRVFWSMDDSCPGGS